MTDIGDEYYVQRSTGKVWLLVDEEDQEINGSLEICLYFQDPNDDSERFWCLGSSVTFVVDLRPATEMEVIAWMSRRE